MKKELFHITVFFEGTQEQAETMQAALAHQRGVHDVEVCRTEFKTKHEKEKRPVQSG